MSTQVTIPPAVLTPLTPALAAAGFVECEREGPPRVFASTVAKEKAGKTHFALTAPGAIAAIASDTGFDEVARKFRRAGKFIMVCSFAVPDSFRKESGRIIVDLEKKREFEADWARVQKAVAAAVREPVIRTLVVDTATEVWELCRLARFGKLAQVMPTDYAVVNAEFRDLLKLMISRKDLNVVLIHKLKKEYRENSKGEGSWTGRYERAGFSEMPYIVDMNLEHGFDSASRQFSVSFLDCPRPNALLAGMTLDGPLCDFPTMASLLFPGTQASYWR